MLIVNHGSKVAISGNGWTNTYETAFKNATDWLLTMKKNNIHDVSIVGSEGPNLYGEWTFTFRHNVTDKQVLLTIHGIDDLAAHMKDKIWPPRIYWNGSSCANPQLTDFLCDGYEICIRKKETA